MLMGMEAPLLDGEEGHCHVVRVRDRPCRYLVVNDREVEVGGGLIAVEVIHEVWVADVSDGQDAHALRLEHGHADGVL